MIGFLRGEVLKVDSESMILLAGGVGYEVTATPASLSELAVGQTADIWIYTQVREDAIQLYGFSSLNEKQMFLSLIKVNGVGPRSAIQILGASRVEQLVEFINQGDAKGLAGLPKVGKKTAEQIILTLRGKLVSAEVISPAASRSVRSEVVSALVNLGFRLGDVERVVERLPHHTDIETGIREGLAALTS